ncbi:hypothetical protein CH268_09410 [Rhodococcus sp. 06-1460-1B]|nr:hypothetical protein CH268_09410 [Rhodococcus sp. 06-1460-1B]
MGTILEVIVRERLRSARLGVAVASSIILGRKRGSGFWKIVLLVYLCQGLHQGLLAILEQTVGFTSVRKA